MLIWPEGAELKVELVRLDGIALALANVALDINFYVSGVKLYSFSAGETDAKGVCSMNYQHVFEQWLENRRLFLMDYNTPLQDCDDEVGIWAPSATELDRRLSAVKRWYGKNSDEAEGIVERSNNHLIDSGEQKIKILPEADIQTMRYICDVN